MFKELQFDSSHLSLGSDGLEPDLNRLQLLPGNLAHQVPIPDRIGELLLNSTYVVEEGLVVLNLLIQNSSCFFIKLGWDVIPINESLIT